VYGRLLCEGRSFEQIDEMTLFDLSMMSQYRAVNPRSEDLLSVIAQWCGAYKPPARQEAVHRISAPDPRPDIRRAFAEAKFADIEGISNVL